MTFDSPADLVPVTILLTAVLGGIAWLIRAQIALHRSFQPNGGTSVKDQLNRIEDDVRDVRSKIDDHVAWHLDN